MKLFNNMRTNGNIRSATRVTIYAVICVWCYRYADGESKLN